MCFLTRRVRTHDLTVFEKFTRLHTYYIFLKDAVVYRYGEWSKYSSCTKSCGNGVRIRTRECFGDVCTGPATETKPCKNLGACPSKWLLATLFYVYAIW